MATGSIFGSGFLEAVKQAAFDHVDRLYADAGVTEGMTKVERYRRISAEYARRRKRAKEIEAQAAFWCAVQRRRDEP